MRSYPFALLWILGSLVACGGGGSDDPAASPPPPPQTNSPAVATYLSGIADAGVRIPREIGDDRALIIEDATAGTVTTYKGQKDGAGALTALTRVEVADAQGMTTSVDYLDATNRLVTVDDKTTVAWTRSGEGEWVVEFVDKVSGTSFRTNMPSATATGFVQASSAQQRRSRALATIAATQPDASPSAATAAATDAQIPVTVTTRNCGQTADALGRVRLTLNDGTGKFLGSYGTVKTGPGTYVGHIPDVSKTTQKSLDTVKSAIETAAQAMSVACAADKASPLLATQACISVSAAIASTAIGAPVAAQFLAACEAAVVAGKLACAAYDKINLPVPDYIDPAAADILPSLDKILVKVLPDSILNSTVTPYIEALPANIRGASVNVTGSGALAASIDQQSLIVGDLMLSPANPAAGVPYQARAQLQCIPFDSSARLTVTGTDGYTDSTSKTWATNTLSDTMQLTVPGAAAGIRDSLSLTVMPRAGSPMTRSAFLVFQ